MIALTIIIFSVIVAAIFTALFVALACLSMGAIWAIAKIFLISCVIVLAACALAYIEDWLL